MKIDIYLLLISMSVIWILKNCGIDDWGWKFWKWYIPVIIIVATVLELLEKHGK